MDNHLFTKLHSDASLNSKKVLSCKAYKPSSERTPVPCQVLLRNSRCLQVLGAPACCPSTYCQQLLLQPCTKQRPQPLLLQRRMLALLLVPSCSSSCGPNAGTVAPELHVCPREWFPGLLWEELEHLCCFQGGKQCVQLTGRAGVAASPVLQEILIIRLLPEIQLGKKKSSN